MIKITDINSSGQGVGRLNGVAVFVSNTVVGETVEVNIVSQEKNYLLGEVVSFAEKSDKRVVPPCKYYGLCGGCNLMHMDYEEQLRCKRNTVQNCLSRIGKTTVVPSATLPAKNTLHYRNKASFPVKNGKIGYYAYGTHNIVEIDACPLVTDEINGVLSALKPFAKKYNDELLHIVVRNTGNELMVTAVTNRENFSFAPTLTEALAPLHPNSVNVNISPNPKHILGKKTVNIFGKATIDYSVLGNRFPLSPTAFAQINDAQTERLYEKALSLVDLSGKRVIDAYCGIGTVSLAIAKRAKSVVGVELNPKAIENAETATRINGVSNAEFICGRCEKVIPMLAKKEKPDVIFVDPPRNGLDKEVVSAVCNEGITTVVYISCNPSTLARDIERFTKLGYEAKEVFPLDMFPQTAHVETVCLMSRVCGDN